MFVPLSKRLKAEQQAREGIVIPLQYGPLLEGFRVQVGRIMVNAIGPPFRREAVGETRTENWKIWSRIEKYVSEEQERWTLGSSNNPATNCLDFLVACEGSACLDLIECAFRCIEARELSPTLQGLLNIGLSAADAIARLNRRFAEHNLGYEFVNGQLVQIADRGAHREIVRPAFELLARDERFQAAEDELSKAFEYYRQGEASYSDSIANAAKSLESTLKAFCAIRNIKVSENATAMPLIKAAFTQGEIVPPYLQDHAANLMGVMQGLASVGNKDGRHGSAEPRTPPKHLVEYALHQAAANILLLVRSCE